jgi:hypothetical protein
MTHIGRLSECHWSMSSKRMRASTAASRHTTKACSSWKYFDNGEAKCLELLNIHICVIKILIPQLFNYRLELK